MANPELTELTFEILAAEATEDDIDRMTRQLLSELRETDAHSAKLVKSGPSPAGAKGDPVTIGSIALEVLPAVLPAVITLVQAWVARGRGRRTVIIKSKDFEFQGSPEELQLVLEKLGRGRKK